MKVLTPICAVLLLAGCATTDGPWSQVDDYYTSQSVKDREAAKIVGLDGQMFTRPPPLRLTPGFHTVLIKSTRQGGPALKPEYATVYLMAKPCVTYTLAAQHECGLCRGWQGVVASSAPIEGCVAEVPAALPADGAAPASAPAPLADKPVENR